MRIKLGILCFSLLVLIFFLISNTQLVKINFLFTSFELEIEKLILYSVGMGIFLSLIIKSILHSYSLLKNKNKSI